MDTRQEELLRIAPRINAEHDIGKLFRLLAREAVRLLKADRASILLLDEKKRELWSPVALGARKPLRFDARLGVAGAAALGGETINVKDVAREPRFYAGIDTRTGYRTRNLLAVPLKTPAGDVVGAFEVLNKKRGAFNAADADVLETLAAQAATAIGNARLVGELAQSRAELRDLKRHFATRGILGTSRRIREIVALIDGIRDTAVNVLITGESGTGKERCAMAIHQSSPRAPSPFVALNCAALPDELVESELFGIEKGVATGVGARRGRFDQAKAGTLFLDEIGDLSLAAQAKILRALQERVIERVGGRAPIKVDVRVIAATNKDLEEEIAAGRFREDLYYRLKVIYMKTPPLREIADDIPLLATHFLASACEEMERGEKTLSDPAIACLQAHPWPGNVRELENEMTRLAAVVRRKRIDVGDLAETIRHGGPVPRGRGDGTLKGAVEDLERQLISEALVRFENNRSAAAASLGLSRQGLLNKMKRHAIE